MMKIVVDEMPKKPEECLFYASLRKTAYPYCSLVGSLNHSCFLQFGEECPNLIKTNCNIEKED